MSMEERDFWLKVDKHGPIPLHRPDLGSCWLWTGNKQSGGYGTLERDRQRRLDAGDSQAAIARSFGLHRGTIGAIARGKTWRAAA